MSRIFPKFWSEISDLRSPKDHKLTLKFEASSIGPSKTVFDKKTGSVLYFLSAKAQLPAGERSMRGMMGMSRSSS